ncbi:MAG: hypothetical protein AAGD00_00770 [Planctomycetota bacterium]
MFKGLFGTKRTDDAPLSDEQFWVWFATESKRLRVISGPKLVDTLCCMMQRVDEGLWAFVNEPSDNDREFIVSADGHRERAPAVRRIVDAAPDVEGWDIIAFKPRFAEPLTFIEFEGQRVEANDIRLLYYPGEGSVDIAVFLRDAKAPGSYKAAEGVLRMLDSALGEADMIERVGKVMFHPLEQAPAGAYPWEDAARVFDAAWASKNPHASE